MFLAREILGTFPSHLLLVPLKMKIAGVQIRPLKVEEDLHGRAMMTMGVPLTGKQVLTKGNPLHGGQGLVDGREDGLPSPLMISNSTMRINFGNLIIEPFSVHFVYYLPYRRQYQDNPVS